MKKIYENLKFYSTEFKKQAELFRGIIDLVKSEKEKNFILDVTKNLYYLKNILDVDIKRLNMAGIDTENKGVNLEVLKKEMPNIISDDDSFARTVLRIMTTFNKEKVVLLFNKYKLNELRAYCLAVLEESSKFMFAKKEGEEHLDTILSQLTKDKEIRFKGEIIDLIKHYFNLKNY